jgi:hypothetical protein
MEPKESKNKGDVLTLDDVHPAIRFGIIAHRQRKRVGLLVASAKSAQLQHAMDGYPVRVALPGGGL